jgi:Glycosyltransferase family 9 (heptosyltransferase)
MNLVTFNEPLTIAFKKSAGGITQTFEASRTYLLANAQMERIMRDPNVQKRTYKVSRPDMRIPNFHIAALKKGQRLLVFNGSGGYGDQIITWPFCKILADMGASVHVLTDPGNNVCWWNLPFVRSVNTVPILWEQVQMYDFFLHFETVTNMDEHQDQDHHLDMLLRKIGIDPEAIDAKNKVVRPVFTPGELGTMTRFIGRKVGLYQLSSANPVRGLPPNDSVFMICRIAEATPHVHWLCLYDEFIPPEYKTTLEAEVAKRGLKNVEAFCSPNLRELWALTEHVSVVVSPDSMMAHIAGVFGTPCIGLWGPVSPENRVKYYANHHPIFHKEYCPHSPCFVYSANFPKYCPPRPATRNVCDVLSGISPSEVIDLVLKLIGGPRPPEVIETYLVKDGQSVT